MEDEVVYAMVEKKALVTIFGKREEDVICSKDELAGAIKRFPDS